jgi:multiple antibiotic resistance protein
MKEVCSAQDRSTSAAEDAKDMNMLGLTLPDIFALLLIAMGPLDVTLSYLPLARELPPNLQRKLACHTVIAGFLVAAALMVIGKGIVQSLQLNQQILLLAVGVTYTVLAFPMLLAEPGDLPPPPQMKDPLRLAISPLAVPVMISPLAVATLLSVSASVPDLITTLVFLGIVLAILLLNFGVMVLSVHLARYITRPFLEALQKIFGFILLAFGLRLLLGALVRLGIITTQGL